MSVDLDNNHQNDDEVERYINNKKSEFLRNSKEESVVSGDTIWKISNKFWFNNVEDFLMFNKILWKDFSKKPDWSPRKKLTIYIGEKYFRPIDINKFRREKDQINALLKQKILNESVAKWNLSDLKEELNENLFPNRPVSLWLTKYLNAFWKYQEVAFEPSHARSVLHWIINWVNFERIASCSHFVKMVFSQSENLKELPEKFRKFLLTENIDAWNFPVEIKKTWSTQKINLMNNFQESLIESIMPIPEKNQENYRKDILNMGNYLRNEWKIWSLVPIYFTWSDYHWDVYKANIWRNDKHFNTHMAIFVWNKTMNFNWSEVISWETDFTNFMLDFLQERVDLVSLWENSGNWRDVLLKWLKKYNWLIDIRINGTPINIAEEIKKPKKEQFKVNKDDKIEISGPMLMDWLHMKNSEDPDKAHNMNARTRFLFEFVATSKFLPTELIEHDPSWPFARETFGDYRDKLDYLAIYDLRKWEILEKKIKKIALEVYKYKFDKIDKNDPEYENKKKELLQYIYARQIKWLQLTGFLQNENKLNHWATNINRWIPFFDIENIDEVYRDYIKDKKQERLNKNAELAPIKTYIDIQTYPWDTHALIFWRILEITKQYIWWKYSNLEKILEFNDILKRKFLKRFFEECIKGDPNVKWEDILSWKFKIWTKFILNLEKLDSIIGEISKLSYTPDLKDKVKTVDERVIEIVSETQENVNMLRKSIIVESYETENWKWYMPNWMRLASKRKQEQYMIARLAKRIIVNHDLNQEEAINSYWDFQIRIRSLKNWYHKEWPTREQLISSVKLLNTKKSIDLINEIKTSNPKIANYIDEDLRKIKVIEWILAKSDPTPEDFNKMTDLFIEILKIDDWTNFSIVWKIIWWNLAEYKLNIHVQKLIWQLEASWENIEEFLKNPENIEMLEEMALLTYNQGETRTLLGISTNYLLRVLQKTNLAEKLEVKLNIPEIEIKSYLFWLISTGALVYWINTYTKHIEENFLPFLIKAKYTATTKEDKKIIEILTDFCENIISNKNLSDKDKVSIASKNILDLVWNKELREILENYPAKNEKWESEKISTSLLPKKDEISWNSFRNNFFNHIRKTNK
jgi:hypothetical protein